MFVIMCITPIIIVTVVVITISTVIAILFYKNLMCHIYILIVKTYMSLVFSHQRFCWAPCPSRCNQQQPANDNFIRINKPAKYF